MASWMIALVAVVSTAAFLFLWFRDVRRIMRERKSTVDSAKAQLNVFRKKAHKDRGDPDAAAVLERGESIYRQAVERSNRQPSSNVYVDKVEWKGALDENGCFKVEVQFRLLYALKG